MLNRVSKLVLVGISVLGFFGVMASSAHAESGKRICAVLGAPADANGQAVKDPQGNPLFVVGVLNERAKNEDNKICEKKIIPEMKNGLKGKGLVLFEVDSKPCEDVGRAFRSSNYNEKAGKHYPDICEAMSKGDTYIAQRTFDDKKIPTFSLQKK